MSDISNIYTEHDRSKQFDKSNPEQWADMVLLVDNENFISADSAKLPTVAFSGENYFESKTFTGLHTGDTKIGDHDSICVNRIIDTAGVTHGSYLDEWIITNPLNNFNNESIQTLLKTDFTSHPMFRQFAFLSASKNAFKSWEADDYEDYLLAYTNNYESPEVCRYDLTCTDRQWVLQSYYWSNDNNRWQLANSQTYTADSFTYTIKQGDSLKQLNALPKRLIVVMQGAGGGGQRGDSGQGGGSGNFGAAVIDTTPGNNWIFFVGNGGQGGNSNHKNGYSGGFVAFYRDEGRLWTDGYVIGPGLGGGIDKPQLRPYFSPDRWPCVWRLNIWEHMSSKPVDYHLGTLGAKGSGSADNSVTLRVLDTNLSIRTPQHEMYDNAKQTYVHNIINTYVVETQLSEYAGTTYFGGIGQANSGGGGGASSVMGSGGAGGAGVNGGQRDGYNAGNYDKTRDNIAYGSGGGGGGYKGVQSSHNGGNGAPGAIWLFY